MQTEWIEAVSLNYAVDMDALAALLRIEPDAAQEYLEDYLGADHLDVYWGSSAEFLEELQETRPHHE